LASLAVALIATTIAAARSNFLHSGGNGQQGEPIGTNSPPRCQPRIFPSAMSTTIATFGAS